MTLVPNTGRSRIRPNREGAPIREWLARARSTEQRGPDSDLPIEVPAGKAGDGKSERPERRIHLHETAIIVVTFLTCAVAVTVISDWIYHPVSTVARMMGWLVRSS
jgi:hypothetical protein